MLKIFHQITEKMTPNWCWISFAFLLYFPGSVLQAPITENVQTKAPTTENLQTKYDNRNLPVIICGIVIAILTLLCVGLAIYICCLKRRYNSQDRVPILRETDTTYYGSGTVNYGHDTHDAQTGYNSEHRVPSVTKTELMEMYFRRETVKLDPDIAHPKLLLKDNTVTHVDQWQDVPDNQYRFDSHLYVLGSEGFKSGTHYWAVEVGDKIEWDLGVASESANRKGPITLSPSNGFWAIGLCNETDYWARSAPIIKLKMTDKPKMIGVYLKYEDGQISFYNLENMSHLYTFSNYKFHGMLYPFFNPGFSLNGMNSVALKIMNGNSLEPYFERKIRSVQ